MLHSSGHSEPKLPHLFTDFLQPWPPLWHYGELPPCHYYVHAKQPTRSLQGVEARLQEELPELRHERARLVDDSLPEGCHDPAEHLVPDVGVDDELQKRESLTVGAGTGWAPRDLMTAKSI